MEPRFSRHVREHFKRVDELAEAAEAVEATMSSPGWQVIAALIDAERAETDRRMDNPFKVLEQAEYAAFHAYRAGLGAASDAALTLTSVAEARLAEESERHESAPALGAGR